MTKKKVVILTGAQGGIGCSVTRRLISDGNFVFALDKVDKGIFSNQENIVCLSCDISDEEEVRNTFSKIKKK